MSTADKKHYAKRWLKAQEDAERIGFAVILAVLPKSIADDMGFVQETSDGGGLDEDLAAVETMILQNQSFERLPDLFAERANIESILDTHKTQSQAWIRQLNELDAKILEVQTEGYHENLDALRSVNADAQEVDPKTAFQDFIEELASRGLELANNTEQIETAKA